MKRLEMLRNHLLPLEVVKLIKRVVPREKV